LSFGVSGALVGFEANGTINLCFGVGGALVSLEANSTINYQPASKTTILRIMMMNLPEVIS
jgi:hypothetical protein